MGDKMIKSKEIYPGLGLVHYVAFPQVLEGEGPILETLDVVLADDTFQTVEISWIKSEALKQRAREMLKRSGKRVVFSGGPPYAYQNINLSALNSEERAHSIDLAKSLIDDALLFGACIHLITGGSDTEPALRDKARDALVHSIVELSDYADAHAKKSPLVLSLEPVDRAVHRKGLVGPIVEAVEIARRVHDLGGKLFLTIDQSHLAELGEKPDNALALADEFLDHIHLANCVISDPKNSLYGDEHPRFGVPGGVHDLPEVVAFLKALQGIGYFIKEPPYSGKPIISVEVKPIGGEDSIMLLKDTKEVLTRAFSQVDVLSVLV
jgi:sugar phosphate isomerase/epimerase